MTIHMLANGAGVTIVDENGIEIFNDQTECVLLENDKKNPESSGKKDLLDSFL